MGINPEHLRAELGERFDAQFDNLWGIEDLSELFEKAKDSMLEISEAASRIKNGGDNNLTELQKMKEYSILLSAIGMRMSLMTAVHEHIMMEKR